jgi:lipopolysaccharide export system protein LptA
MFPNKQWLLSLLVMSMLTPAWALRSDRNQPIDIKADRVEVDQKQEVSHYIGHVRLEQGSLKIDADEIVVYMAQGNLVKIVITGKPARFEQQPENQQEIVNSQAENMEYYASEERLLLKHNAEVNQGANHFRGDFIEYDTLTSTVKANKDENSQSRVHAIIQPTQSNKANGQTPQTPSTPPPVGTQSPAPTTSTPKHDVAPTAPATDKP